MNVGREMASPAEDSPGGETRGHRKDQDPISVSLLEHLVLEPIHRVLEVGCMDGALALEMARRAGFVAGVDTSDELVAAAENRWLQSGADNLSFGTTSPDHLPFPEESFDLLVSRGFLHRLENPAAMVSEMSRVLGPAGKLYVADIIGADDPSVREIQEKIELVRFGPPISLLSVSALRALVDIDALEIIHQASFSEHVDVTAWLPPGRVDPQTRERVLRMLSTTAKRKPKEVKTHAGGKALTLERRWVLITAAKAGGMREVFG